MAAHDPDTGLTPAMTVFLENYEACGIISTAAFAAQIHPSTHYKWLKQNPIYADAWKDSYHLAVDRLEAEARRRAVEGVRRYKFDRGMPILRPGATLDDPDPYYFELEYSDRLLELLLRGKRPDEFGHKFSGEISGAGGGPLELTHSLRQIALLNEEVCEHLSEALAHATDGSPDGGVDSNGDAGGVCVDGE